jgi:hypothetical protein
VTCRGSSLPAPTRSSSKRRFCCGCSRPVLALSGRTREVWYLSAFGGKAVIATRSPNDRDPWVHALL